MKGTPGAGFTLVELLVVMVLLGLSASLVMISVSSGVLGSRERSFVQEFQHTLSRARLAGLSSGMPARFLIDGQRRAFSLGGRHWVDIPETIQVEGKGILEARPGVFEVVFYPDGSSSGAELDILWENGDADILRVDRVLGLVTRRHRHGP